MSVLNTAHEGNSWFSWYGMRHPMTREDVIWVCSTRIIHRAYRQMHETGCKMPTRDEVRAAAKIVAGV